MTISIFHLPLEIIETILLFATPSAVGAFSQTCKLYHSLIYSSRDNHFWRNFFFAQGLYDDPRLKPNPQNPTLRWDKFVQRWTAAANVFRKSRPITNINTISSLLELVDYARPHPNASLNLHYLKDLFDGHDDVAAVLDGFPHNEAKVTSNRMQLVHRFKVFFGWATIRRDYRARLNSRCYIYNLENYKKSNSYGPFLQDGSGRVNWVHIYNVLMVLASNILDIADDDRTVLPWEVQALQQDGVIYPTTTKDVVRCEEDWAGITGKWKIIFSFCDHRDLIAFNNPSLFSDQPSPNIFEDEDFEEALRELDFDFSVVGLSEVANQKWPTRPTLQFIGKTGTSHRITGNVYMGPDDEVHWSFVSGEGHPMWSIQAVQIGGVGSAYGALGTWTTVIHEEDDPVGQYLFEYMNTLECLLGLTELGPTWIRKYM